MWFNKTSSLWNPQDMDNNKCEVIVSIGHPWEAFQGFTMEQGFEAMSRDGMLRN